jgi:hypothetical protein
VVDQSPCAVDYHARLLEFARSGVLNVRKIAVSRSGALRVQLLAAAAAGGRGSLKKKRSFIQPPKVNLEPWVSGGSRWCRLAVTDRRWLGIVPVLQCFQGSELVKWSVERFPPHVWVAIFQHGLGSLFVAIFFRDVGIIAPIGPSLSAYGPPTVHMVAHVVAHVAANVVVCVHPPHWRSCADLTNTRHQHQHQH